MSAANPARIAQSAVAVSKSPRLTLLKISRDSVLVRSDMLPPIIIVTPTSPEALAKPSKSAAKRFPETNGIETKTAVLKRFSPCTKAASSSSRA